MSPDPEEIQHESVDREKPLRVRGRCEPAHLSLALSRRLMRNLCAVVRILPRAVNHGWHHGAVRRGSCHPPDWANPWGRVHRRSAATPNNNTPAIIGARQSPAPTRVANITKQTTAPSAGTAIGSSNAP